MTRKQALASSWAVSPAFYGVNISFYKSLVKQGDSEDSDHVHMFLLIIPPASSPHTTPDQIPLKLSLKCFIFQSPHGGDDLSEGEGDVGSPEDDIGQKASISISMY